MTELVSKKTERLHMLISPDDLKAIDDFRFKNRIATRAEAVRQLYLYALGHMKDAANDR